MKLKFDSSLEYLREAIKNVTDLFEGLPEQQSSLSFAHEIIPLQAEVK